MSKQNLQEGAMDLIFTYQFLKRLTTPFEKTKAYELGIIDEDGKVLKKAKELKTEQEKKAYGYFDRLVFGLKRLLEKVPGGKSRFASYAAALYLIKESANPKEHYTEQELAEGLMENLTMLEKTSTKKLNEMLGEDAPANATGAAVVGTGDDPAHWVDKKRKIDFRFKEMKAVLRRYQEGKAKRESLKTKKDFKEKLGLK